MKPIPLADLMVKEFPEANWLVEGLIPSEGMTVLSAAPSSFKTWLLLDLAICIASGKSLFGQYKTSETGVLIIDEEDNERLLQQRLSMLGAKIESPIHLLIEQGFQLTDKWVSQTIEHCLENGLGLVTFDSLVRI